MKYIQLYLPECSSNSSYWHHKYSGCSNKNTCPSTQAFQGMRPFSCTLLKAQEFICWQADRISVGRETRSVGWRGPAEARGICAALCPSCDFLPPLVLPETLQTKQEHLCSERLTCERTALSYWTIFPLRGWMSQCLHSSKETWGDRAVLGLLDQEASGAIPGQSMWSGWLVLSRDTHGL